MEREVDVGLSCWVGHHYTPSCNLYLHYRETVSGRALTVRVAMAVQLTRLIVQMAQSHTNPLPP